jgi:hypothetical protein
MSNLESKFKFLDQQLQQVNSMLDTEWEEHLTKSKSKVRPVFCIAIFRQFWSKLKVE